MTIPQAVAKVQQIKAHEAAEVRYRRDAGLPDDGSSSRYQAAVNGLQALALVRLRKGNPT